MQSDSSFRPTKNTYYFCRTAVTQGQGKYFYRIFYLPATILLLSLQILCV